LPHFAQSTQYGPVRPVVLTVIGQCSVSSMGSVRSYKHAQNERRKYMDEKKWTSSATV